MKSHHGTWSYIESVIDTPVDIGVSVLADMLKLTAACVCDVLFITFSLS